MENSGEVYTNDMYNKAKDFYQQKQEEDEKEKEAKLRIKIESELRGKIESELRNKIESEFKDKIELEIRNNIKEESEAEMTSKQSGLQSKHLQSDTRGRVRGPMAGTYINIFKKKIPELIKMLKEPAKLLPSLSATDLFDDDDKEQVEKEIRNNGNQAGMTKLLYTLLDCGPDAFQLFVKCLKANNCIPALDLLESSISDVNTVEEEKKAGNKTEEKKTEEKKTHGKDSLHKCIVNSQHKIDSELLLQIQSLIQDGADINSIDRSGCTPLMLACGKGLTSVINWLLDREADVNLVDCNGDIVLHYIVKNENDDIIPCIERIINTGINYNIQNKHKQTPLMLTCEFGLTSFIDLLLDHKADVNLVDNINNTVLHYAVTNKHDDIIHCIERIIDTCRLNINLKNGRKQTPLMIACVKGLTSVINVLLDHGADINLVDLMGNTVLHDIVQNKHDDNSISRIERIMKTDININIQNKNKQTPLILACEKGLTSAINLLLDHGADVNLVDLSGDTVLHYIVKNKHDDNIPYIKKIIKTDIDINIQNEYYKQTPLMIACKEGLTSVINLLLDHGADVNLVDNAGDTVLHYMVKNKHGDIIPCIERIIKTDIDINIHNILTKKTPLMIACMLGITSVINFLLDHGADVNLIDIKGDTVLHLMGTPKHDAIIPCIERIIKSGININIQNSGNQTPLMIACRYRLIPVINVLLDYRANVNLVDKEGETVLHYLVTCKDEEIIPCIERIIESGININIQNIRGETALDIAYERGLLSVKSLLLDHRACES